MLKHHLRKLLKKKHHPKKSGQETHLHQIEETVPPFVIFGLDAIGVFAIVIPVILVVWAIGDFEMRYSERFYPGVFIGGEPVGGQTYSEALNHFKEKKEKLEREGLTLEIEGSRAAQEIKIPMFSEGLSADISIEYFSFGDFENTVREAYEWGHSINLLSRSKDQLRLLFGEKNFNFTVSIHREALNSLLANEVNNFFKKSVPAGFLFEKNKILISKEVIGENINAEELINILKGKLAQFDVSPAIFQAHTEIPNVRETDLEPFLDFASNIARKTNLVLQYKDRSWKIKGPKLVTWLTVRKGGGIGIDRAKLEDYLTNTVAKIIDNPPKDSRFEMRNGKLIEILPGRSGNIVDVDKTMQKIGKIITSLEAEFNPKNGTIYLPIETMIVEPKVTKDTVDKYKIKDLVGEIRTNFTGSTPGREHNIKIGVGTITGLVIAPGAEFSAVRAVGHVSAKEGYLKELVIKEDRTTKEFGGGLCQVATTLFRLALNAGMLITERINHRFVVQYYGKPGTDATVYGPHPDFRFVNDTGNYLLLQGRVDSESKQVIMELYGQRDGRSAEISEPTLYNKIPAPPTKYILSDELPMGKTKCTEKAHDGITSDVLYTVKYADGTVKKRNFRSVYQPWQAVCLVGTAITPVESEINDITLVR